MQRKTKDILNSIIFNTFIESKSLLNYIQTVVSTHYLFFFTNSENIRKSRQSCIFFLLLFWLLSCLLSKLRGSTSSIDLFSVLSGFASYPLQLFLVNTWRQARFVLQRRLSLNSVVFK